MAMIHLSQQLKLQQKLTPQQVQYLKLLQLPVLALEQRLKNELETNPLLEEGMEDDFEQTTTDETEPVETEPGQTDGSAEEDSFSLDDYVNEEFWGTTYEPAAGDEEREEVPIPSSIPMHHRLLDQLQLLDLDDEELLLGQEIIGNIDEDGYLRRDLSLIVQDVNLTHKAALSQEKAEQVLMRVHQLDPPGIGARTLQECLIAQLEVGSFEPRIKDLAINVLREYYDDFSLKHYEDLARNLGIPLNEVKRIFEIIQRLNPKPGEGEFSAQENYIVPDFNVHYDDGEFIIQLNDRNIPPLRINKSYREIISRKKKDGLSPDAKAFIRNKFDTAKWFITSLHQRRQTLLKVMHTIVDKQREFFETGENLKPMIYKDVANSIQMDISTISRVVNGKYLQMDFGVYELKHFFSDKIETVTGEEISNKEVKNKIREIIQEEDPRKPLSDDRIADILHQEGLNIARRTVAKYREHMKIPVARLRRKI